MIRSIIAQYYHAYTTCQLFLTAVPHGIVMELNLHWPSYINTLSVCIGLPTLTSVASDLLNDAL